MTTVTSFAVLCANLAMRGSELPYYGALQWLQLRNPVVPEVVESVHALHRPAARVEARADVAAAAAAVAGNLRAAAAERARAHARAADASALRGRRAEDRRASRAHASRARGRVAAASGQDRVLRFSA